MAHPPVYLDHHATTPVDPRVVEAMLPFFQQQFGNPGSTSHSFGWDAKDAVDAARESIAATIGATAREIIFTSGATESNNLVLRGLADRPRRRGNHIVSVSTEHKAMLDPLALLRRRGMEVTLLDVVPQEQAEAGRIDLQQLEDALREDTLLVSVMLANNEIGVLQPLADIARVCQQRGVLLHTDATQAVGRVPLDVNTLGVDLLSFTAHKLYGPKGIGALYVGRRRPPVRLQSQIDGGGQELGLRSGTLNVPGIVGFARACQLCIEEMSTEQPRQAELRDHLWEGLHTTIDRVQLNGPDFQTRPDLRLAGNLNCSFAGVDGEALMMSMRELAVSSGSACTSANPEPSHVLRGLGLSDDRTRASLRFGLGRTTTREEIDFAVQTIAAAVDRLRSLSSRA